MKDRDDLDAVQDLLFEAVMNSLRENPSAAEKRIALDLLRHNGVVAGPKQLGELAGAMEDDIAPEDLPPPPKTYRQ